MTVKTRDLKGGEVELFVGYGDDNPNVVVWPDRNRDPQEVTETAGIDLNADIGLVIDMNGTKPEHRGDNVEENEAAQDALDSALAEVTPTELPPDKPPGEGEEGEVVEEWDPNGVNNIRSIYFRPALDFKDPPDLEQSEPPAMPAPHPPLDVGLLRRAEDE